MTGKKQGDLLIQVIA